MQIHGRAFMVTGGSSGLGAATVKALLDRGARIIVADINEEAGETLASGKDEALFVRTDVTDQESVRAAMDAARRAFGGLNGLVNCAGVAPAIKVIGRKGVHPLDAFAKAVQINLTGTFNAIRLASEAMVENEPDEEGERGVIVNTASVAAFDGKIGHAAYSASKGGVVGMTLPIARELARHGIRVMTIAPGMFETPMLAELAQGTQDSLGEQVPFPSRLGRPREYAALVEHIIENQMLNGEVIRLDGAIRMQP
jgi:NAD(P)-dependent dehydrogenase (short-subunit alcohol dehydrogenase family)